MIQDKICVHSGKKSMIKRGNKYAHSSTHTHKYMKTFSSVGHKNEFAFNMNGD